MQFVPETYPHGDGKVFNASHNWLTRFANRMSIPNRKGPIPGICIYVCWCHSLLYITGTLKTQPASDTSSSNHRQQHHSVSSHLATPDISLSASSLHGLELDQSLFFQSSVGAAAAAAAGTATSTSSSSHFADVSDSSDDESVVHSTSLPLTSTTTTTHVTTTSTHITAAAADTVTVSVLGKKQRVVARKSDKKGGAAEEEAHVEVDAVESATVILWAECCCLTCVCVALIHITLRFNLLFVIVISVVNNTYIHTVFKIHTVPLNKQSSVWIRAGGGQSRKNRYVLLPTKSIRLAVGGKVRPYQMTEILKLLLLCVLLCKTLLHQKTFYIATHNWTKRYSQK